MNTVSLLGRVVGRPVYFCTKGGHDLTRIILRTETGPPTNRTRQSHHCIAWGPAALQLHEHLRPGDRLMVGGELRYRQRKDAAGRTSVRTEIHVLGFTFLDTPQIRSSRVTMVS